MWRLKKTLLQKIYDVSGLFFFDHNIDLSEKSSEDFNSLAPEVFSCKHTLLSSSASQVPVGQVMAKIDIPYYAI